MSRLRQIYRAAGASAGLEILGMGLGYLGQLVLARWLGVDAFGVFVFVTSLMLMLAIPAQLGLSMLIVRDASPMRSAEAPGETLGLLRRAYQISVMTALVLVIVVAGLDFGFLSGSPYARNVTIGALALPFLVCNALNIGLARARGQINIVKAASDVGRPLLLLLGIGGLAISSFGASSRIAIGLFVTATALATVLQFVRLYQLRVIERRHVAPSYQTRLWLKTAAPFALVGVIDVLMRQTDLIMVGSLLTSDAAGRYAVASRLATLVTLSMVAMNMLAAPAYADLYRQNDIVGMQLLARRLAHGMFWPAAAVATGLVAGGPWLIDLFGPGFSGAYTPLLILMVGGLFNVGAGSVGYLANMTGHQSYVVGIQGAAVVLNILGNAWLIPRYGLNGAAVATAFSTALANIGLHIVVSRRVGVRAAIVFAGRPVF